LSAGRAAGLVSSLLAGTLFFGGPPALVTAALSMRAAGRVEGRHLIEARLRAHEPAARAAAEKHGVELALVLAVAAVESSGHASARSGAGAVGLMQLLPETARELAAARRLPQPDLEDPAQSLDLGAMYLRRQLDDFAGHAASEDLALAAYNAGPSRVRSWVERDPPPSGAESLGDWIPFDETRNFVSRVRRWRERWRSAPQAAAELPRE
jgi:soluble lytic murein transglycosylase